MLKFLKKKMVLQMAGISVVSLYSSDIGTGAYSGRSEPSDKKRGGAGGGGFSSDFKVAGRNHSFRP